MKVCRKCGAQIGTPNCCENGALEKPKATRKRTVPPKPAPVKVGE